MDGPPPAYGSPAPSFGSPAPDVVTPVHHAVDTSVGSASQSNLRPLTNTDVKDVNNSANSLASNTQSTLGAAASNGSDAIPTSGDDLRAKLAEAKATISRLSKQVQDQGLTQKKSDAINQDSRERITTGMTGMGIQQQPADGVPVQIVAALCLLSFLLAYFFF